MRYHFLYLIDKFKSCLSALHGTSIERTYIRLGLIVFEEELCHLFK